MLTHTRPRLLLVGNHLSGSGAVFSIEEALAARFREKGYAVLSTSRTVNRPLRLLDMLRTTFAQRDAYDAAIVHVYSGWAFVWAEAVTRLLGRLRKPYVVSLHGGGLAEFCRRQPCRVARLLDGADAVTTPSQFLQQSLLSACSGIRYLPNGLDLAAYPFRPRQQVSPRLCWLRALHRVYRPLMAVEAFARVVKDSPSARLTLIGPDKGDGTSQLVRQRIAGLGLGASIECVGPVPKDEVPVWLARSDIFLNTTQYESFGVGVLEAAACGLCIVTTDVGELPYLWSHGRDALLVPSGDSEAMAREVLRVMQDPQLAARLSANARSRAEQFDWSVILPKWEQLLDEVAAKNGKMRTASAAAAEAPTPDCRPEAGASQISATKCQAAED